MSKEDLEPKLAEIMDQIPEVEGVIAFDVAGKVISGQTIENKDNKISGYNQAKRQHAQLVT